MAVEEQFYILFPIFILLAWRHGKRAIVTALVAIAILSLGLAQWGAFNRPAAAFFLLPTRAWELLIGVLVAFYFSYSKKSEASERLNQTGSFFGLMLIVYAILAFDKYTPFPGLYALFPTIGTALIILFSTPQTLTGKILSNRLLVGIGLVSYSAYLWHQPLFAFARHRSLVSPVTS